MQTQSNLSNTSEILLNNKQADFLEAFLNNLADTPDRKDPRGWGFTGGWRATAQCGRGFGKSHLLCHIIALSASELPGARAGLVGLTLRQVSDIILSQSAEVFKSWGYEEYNSKTGTGCYTVNQRPPEHWQKAKYPLRKYDNCICFANGYTVDFLSVGQIQAKRGTSLDQLFIDESATIKEEIFNKVLRPTVRANKYAYQDTRPGRKGFNHPLHWAIIDFTSAPWLAEGRWIYKTEDLAQQKPYKYHYMQGSAYDNLMFLPGNYIEDQREVLDPLSFDVEILNKRRTKNPNSFYSAFSDRHVYMDYERLDYAPNRPLEISWDFNAKFTSVSIWQDFGNEFKCIDVLWVKEAPDGLLVNKLTNDLITRYKNHNNKRVVLYGDNGGSKKDANRKPYFEDIKTAFRKDKWVIFDEVQTGYPPYNIRYKLVNEILKGTVAKVPTILINGWSAKAMVMSLQDAPIVGDNFEKDKSSEKKDIPQEFATHLSDTFDYIMFRKFSKYLSYIIAKARPFLFKKSS